MFGLETFSFTTAYLRCTGEQLLNAFNDKGRLGRIYKGLLQYLLTKYGGSEILPCIKSLDCYHSPITRTLFLIKQNGEAHLKSTLTKFFLQPAPLESIWTNESSMLPLLTKQTSNKLLQKLFTENITSLEKIIFPNGTKLMNLEEFSWYHSKPTRLIKVP